MGGRIYTPTTNTAAMVFDSGGDAETTVVVSGTLSHARCKHTGTGGITVTAKDANGYDYFRGLGSVGTTGLDLGPDEIGGHAIPPNTTLTITASGGTEDETMTISLYFLN